MEIFCDYCGSKFDTEGKQNCPSCGASFSHDEEILKAAEQENRLRELKIKEKELDLKKAEAKNDDSIKIKIKNTKSTRAATIIIFMVVAFSLIVVFIAATSGLRGKKIDKDAINAQASSIKSNIPVITFAEETEVPVSVAFNETAQTVNYSVICDSFEKIDRYPFTPDEGNMYVSFHFIIKNTSIGKVNPPAAFYCSVNGEKYSKIWDNQRKEPPMGTLPAGVSSTGNICFEVPIDAEYFDISYGDYVTIHIENTIK